MQVAAVASWVLSRGKEADRLAIVQFKADVTFVLFNSEPLLYVVLHYEEVRIHRARC